jgi:hypothetical protein
MAPIRRRSQGVDVAFNHTRSTNLSALISWRVYRGEGGSSAGRCLIRYIAFSLMKLIDDNTHMEFVPGTPLLAFSN